MRVAPSQNNLASFQPKLNKLALAVSLLISASLVNAEVLVLKDKEKYEFSPDKPDVVFDGIQAAISPYIEHNQFTFSIGSNQSMTVNGLTEVESIADELRPGYHQGTYLFSVRGGGSLLLNGDVDILAIHPNVQVDGIGNNVFWAEGEGSNVKIGNSESTTKAWALAKKPDLISAKDGAIVVLNSKHNQLVGSIDFIGNKLGTEGSKVNGTFSGQDSFWFGNEQSFQNLKSMEVNLNTSVLTIEVKDLLENPVIANGKEGLENILGGTLIDAGVDQEQVNSAINKLANLPHIGSVINGYRDQINKLFSTVSENLISDLLSLDSSKVSDSLDLIFENGAQWSYFGDLESITIDKKIDVKKYLEQAGYGDLGILANLLSITAQATVTTTPKRVSSITLNGGIINLFDKNIQEIWGSLEHNGKSLLDLWPELATVNHDYVRIGDLKGNGGIFRLDLDAENKQNSDMVFIESSSDGGQHFIEPYNMELLESVSPTNTLTFALQEALPDNDGKFVSFAEKQNIYGQSLFDYELEIDSRVIENEDQIKDIHYNSWETDGWDFDASDASKYVNGKEWFIKRVELIESAASIGMRSAGYASYDLAVSMDRRDRRLHDAVFQNEEKDGLWTRIQYGEAGAEHLYNADLTTVYVGYEKATSPDNRLGFSFGYTDGDSDFSDLKGSGELKRYEASVYDTLTFGSHYLDFVARFGQVENDFDVTNQAGTLTTSGSFDQKYAALSAEYGYNFKDEHNVFIEPQVQLQVAYLGDYDYRTERNMKVEADNDVSVIGRVGLRTGKAFESADYAGELYARADVLHQFTDGQDADFSDLSHKVGVTWGDKDTWSTFGVGGYLNWKDNMSFQVDVERTAGGETTDTWLVSGRFNYLF